MEDGIYSVVIKAKDKAGKTSRGLSNTFIVDSSPPTIKHVHHGHQNELLQYLNKKLHTFRAYLELEDDLAKIVSYKVGVGSYSGADDVLSFESIKLHFPLSRVLASWTSSRPTTLKNGRKYYITVWAINSAGLFSITSSKALFADSEPPKNGVILDGWGASDTEYQSYSFVYRVHWYGFTDFSGLDKIYVGLSTKPNSKLCDVKPLEVVQSGMNYHILSGLSLRTGNRYYACVKSVDKAGNSAFYSSNGVLVDTTPPRSGQVQDGRPGNDEDVQTESSILRATWSNFTETETEITSYELAFGTFPGKDNIQEFINVGLVTTAASSKLKVAELSSGQRYYATVIAYNILGMPSTKVSSDGVLVDFTPPAFAVTARDGLKLTSDKKFTSTKTLSVVWKCIDNETGLTEVKVL